MHVYEINVGLIFVERETFKRTSDKILKISTKLQQQYDENAFNGKPTRSRDVLIANFTKPRIKISFKSVTDSTRFNAF